MNIKWPLWLTGKYKVPSSNVVSMDALYWQIQKMMDEAGIGDRNLTVNSTTYGHGHIKKEKGNHVKPETRITVHMSNSLVAHDVTSPTIAIERVKSYLLQKKASTDVIEDVTVEINEELV